MKTFKSVFLINDYVPDDSLIYNALEDVGYNGFLPKTFIADLLIISKCKVLRFHWPSASPLTYINVLCDIIESVNIVNWVRDTIYLVKRISEKYDLRTIETYANNGVIFNLKDVKFSFNYVFDINSIDEHIQKLLNISEDQMKEVEELPIDVVDILTISNGLGSFLKTSKRIIASNKQMSSYGDVVKVHKHAFADPLFKYKFSIKAYDLDTDTVITHKSNKIVIGYFFGSYKRQGIVNILIKLLGTIILNNYVKDIKIVIYSFYMDTYSKKELYSIDDIIQYFSNSKQLKLFLINNSKSLEKMVTENPGDDVIFIPNILNSCYIRNDISGSNRVNIISVKESNYNLQYASVCKKTGGTFLTI